MHASSLWGSCPVGARQAGLYRRCGYHLAKYHFWTNTDYTSAIFVKCIHESVPHGLLDRMLLKTTLALSARKHHVQTAP